jgi:transcriptional regulator GlxA family with amidase domain
MNRRTFLRGTALAAAAASVSGAPLFAASNVSNDGEAADDRARDRRINVAFVISAGANVIDLAGPWEVFQDAMLSDGPQTRAAFRLYTVSDSPRPIEATGGLRLVPHYTLRNAPTPAIISVGAQRGSDSIRAWLGEQSKRVELMMSVCTGAFQLARAGLLDGRRATTHHEFWEKMAREHPRVRLERGPRFVADGNVWTAGGLTSGVDLALHVVQRVHGEEVAARTARYMEYESERWRSAVG